VYVCHCRGVTDRTVAACIAAGADTVEEIGRRCGAGVRCGSCVPLLEALLAQAALAVPASDDVAA
jgi:bacterioferritin-associated ferredoxin